MALLQSGLTSLLLILCTFCSRTSAVPQQRGQCSLQYILRKNGTLFWPRILHCRTFNCCKKTFKCI